MAWVITNPGATTGAGAGGCGSLLLWHLILGVEGWPWSEELLDGDDGGPPPPVLPVCGGGVHPPAPCGVRGAGIAEGSSRGVVDPGGAPDVPPWPG